MSEANRDLTLFVRGQLKRRVLRFIGSSLKGLAVDSQGNAWVASLKEGSVYGIRPKRLDHRAVQGWRHQRSVGRDGGWGGQAESRSSAGSTGPPAPGAKTGDPISPASGYTMPSAGSEVLLANGNPLY